MEFCLKVRDDILTCEGQLFANSGNSGVYRCRFDISSEFENITWFCVFKTAEDAYVSMIENGICMVPGEALENSGKVLIGCYATDCNEENTLRISTNFVDLTVEEGAYCTANIPKPASADVWEQLAVKSAPIIGGNGNWYAYDIQSREYVDTGKPSYGIQGEKGETGDTPARGVDYWTAEDTAEISAEIDGKISIKADKSDMEALKAVSLPRTERTVMSSLITLTDHAPDEKLLSARVYGKADGVGEACEDGRYKISLKICGKNIFNPEQFLNCSGWTYTDGAYKGRVHDLFVVYGYDKNGFDIPHIYKVLKISFTGKNEKLKTFTTGFQVYYTSNNYSNIGFMNKTEWTKYSGRTGIPSYKKLSMGYSNEDTVYLRDILICDSVFDDTYEPYMGSSATAYIDTPLGEGDYIDFVRGIRVNADGSETDAEITGMLTALDSEVNYIWCDNSPAKIEVGYYQDINKVIEELKNAILAQGANV